MKEIEDLKVSQGNSSTVTGVSLDPNSGDLWWIAADGESGYGDPVEAYEAATDGAALDYPVQLARARSLPEVWAVRVALTRDDDGEPDDTEVRCFNTEAEAEAALASALSASPPLLVGDEDSGSAVSQSGSALHGAPSGAEPSAAVALAMRFHESYERLAPGFGYKTREASAKPWAEVPSHNKALMIAVCAELLGAAS